MKVCEGGCVKVYGTMRVGRKREGGEMGVGGTGRRRDRLGSRQK